MGGYMLDTISRIWNGKLGGPVWEGIPDIFK